MAAMALLAGAAPVGATHLHDVRAQDADEVSGPVVEVLPVRGFLDPPLVSAMVRLIDNAQRDGVELVIIQIDGPGAISADADRLLQAVQGSTVPVAVFVAAQQGLFAEAGGLYGLLWATAPVRAMSEFATVGPIDPLDLASGVGPDAVQREFVTAIGAGAALEEAVAAADLERAGAVDVLAGNVAALLAEMDGLEVVLADGTATTLDLGAQEVNVRLHSLGILARLLHAAAAPAFIYLLLVFGIGTLAFELFQPGFGVAGFAGLVLLPFAIFGLVVLPVTWWALGLLLLGFVLYGIDTAMAGLGPVTATATASFGTGSWFLFGTDALRVPPALAVVTTVAALAFFVVVLTVILRAQAGPEGVDLNDLVGRHGMVRSVLNPEGHVYVDDALWRARVDHDQRLRVGAPVTVTGVDGPVLVVAPFDATAATPASTPPASSADPPAS